jgi:hypothetical protein
MKVHLLLFVFGYCHCQPKQSKGYPITTIPASRYPTQINKVWPPDKIFNSFVGWFFPTNKHAIRIAQLIGLFERLMCKDLIQCLRNKLISTLVIYSELDWNFQWQKGTLPKPSSCLPVVQIFSTKQAYKDVCQNKPIMIPPFPSIYKRKGWRTNLLLSLVTDFSWTAGTLYLTFRIRFHSKRICDLATAKEPFENCVVKCK